MRKNERIAVDQLIEKYFGPEYRHKVTSMLDEVAQSTLNKVELKDNGERIYVYIKSARKTGPCSFYSKSVAKLKKLHKNHYYALTRALDIMHFSMSVEIAASSYIFHEYAVREIIARDPLWQAICDNAFAKMKEILATGSHIATQKQFTADQLRKSLTKAMGLLSDEEIQTVWDECRVKSVMES